MSTAVPAASTAGCSTKAPSENGWSVTEVAARSTTGERLSTNAGTSAGPRPNTPPKAASLAGSACSWDRKSAVVQAGGVVVAYIAAVSPDCGPMAATVATCGASVPNGVVVGFAPANEVVCTAAASAEGPESAIQVPAPPATSPAATRPATILAASGRRV